MRDEYGSCADLAHDMKNFEVRKYVGNRIIYSGPV